MTEEEAKAPAREVREIKEAEVPWVVAYLREDIQDLRHEVREVRRITIESYEKLDAKLDAGLARLDAKIDARTDDLDAKLDARTEELRQEMGELRREMGELRREMGVQFRWTIGIVIGATLTMTSVFAWIVDRMLTP